MNTNVNVKTHINRAARVSRNDQLSIISVYSFDSENIAGLFSNNLYGKELPFGNLMTMLLMLEDCMNSISWPQPMADYRNMNSLSETRYRKKSYRDKTDISIPYMTPPEVWKDSAPLATFGVRILFRTISGWQGIVTCRETGKSRKFVSDLELIMFILEQLNMQTQ